MQELLINAIDWIFENEGSAILTLGLAGAFSPMLSIIIVRLLSYPGIRNAVGLAAFTWGKTISITLTRWLPKRGEQLETSLQDFVVFFINKVTEGLDSDDTVVTTKPKENENTE